MNTKLCKKCNIEKNIENFRLKKDKSGKYYIYSYCKECEASRNKIYLKKYCVEKKDKLKEYRKKNYQENKAKKNEYQKKYYQEHKLEKSIYDKHYKQTYKAIKNKRELEKLHNDKIYYLKHQLRHCILKSFKRKKFYKKDFTKNIIGCDIDYFIDYLLETYKNNYGCEWDGVEKIHIDHIMPLAIANTEEEVMKLCNYKNLQLLKAHDNLVKGANLIYNGGE